MKCTILKPQLLACFLFVLLPLTAHAGAAQDEARAHRLFTEVRCVQCQSESIADSDAPIANDMRRQIRLDIVQGKSDTSIRKNLFDHYGDYVLFRPRLSLSNMPLWVLPPLLLFLGGLVFIVFNKKQDIPTPYDLNEEEEEKLKALLKKHD